MSLIVDGCEPEVAVIKETYGELTATQVKSFLGNLQKWHKNVTRMSFRYL
ncbi:hypothetical protein O9992_26985 [Vibrio lentus]|nr:hypothetical protein [Vibrio lentus]